MRILLSAVPGLALAVWLMGLAPLAGPSGPRWEALRTELAAAEPQARLAAQGDVLLAAAGLSHPVPDSVQGN